jgi:hypothetical protein
MKKIIIILTLFNIYIHCSAQTKLIPGVFKGKHDSFIIKKFQLPGLEPYIGIDSKNNKYYNGIPYTKE